MQQEQPDLFGFSAPSKPSARSTPSDKPSTTTHNPSPAIKPYTPSLIPYARWLDIFCGDKTLAYWYYSHQPDVEDIA